MSRSIAALLCLCVAVAAPRAEAQNPQAAPPGVTPAPMAPSNAPSPPPEKIAPPGKDAQPGDSAHAGDTLSHRLAQQHGTLDPPHGIDPGMTVDPPTQAQGSMRVIPPPGSPGAKQQAIPK